MAFHILINMPWQTYGKAYGQLAQSNISKDLLSYYHLMSILNKELG